MLELGPHAVVKDGVVLVTLIAPWTRQWFPEGRLLSRQKPVQQVKEKAIVSTLLPMILLKMLNQHVRCTHRASTKQAGVAQFLTMAKKEGPGLLIRGQEPWCQLRNLRMKS